MCAIFDQRRPRCAVQDHPNHPRVQSQHIRPLPEPQVVPHRERRPSLRVPHPVAPPRDCVYIASNDDSTEKRSGRRVPHLAGYLPREVAEPGAVAGAVVHLAEPKKPPGRAPWEGQGVKGAGRFLVLPYNPRAVVNFPLAGRLGL